MIFTVKTKSFVIVYDVLRENDDENAIVPSFWHVHTIVITAGVPPFLTYKDTVSSSPDSNTKGKLTANVVVSNPPTADRQYVISIVSS